MKFYLNDEEIVATKIEIKRDLGTIYDVCKVDIDKFIETKEDDEVIIKLDNIDIFKGKIGYSRTISNGNMLKTYLTVREDTSKIADAFFDKTTTLSSNSTIENIVKKILEPLGLNYTIDVSLANIKTKEILLQFIGGNVVDFLNNLLATRNAVLTSDGLGKAVITNQTSQGSIILDDRISYFSIEKDYQDTYDKVSIFSQDTYKGDSIDTNGVFGDGKKAISYVDQNSLDKANCEKKAEFYHSLFKRKSIQYKLRVPYIYNIGINNQLTFRYAKENYIGNIKSVILSNNGGELNTHFCIERLLND